MTAAVLFAVRKPQPDLDPQERLPDDPVTVSYTHLTLPTICSV